tara:strand:- start:237 stop:395 length:159 start_codon:yes stop_codon:yes gene_type:complete
VKQGYIDLLQDAVPNFPGVRQKIEEYGATLAEQEALEALETFTQKSELKYWV